MSEPKIYFAESIPEYVKIISDIGKVEKQAIWFRGHTKASYRLEPSVLRDTEPHYDGRGNKLTGDYVPMSSGYSATGLNPERMLEEFKRRAINFVSREPRNDFEWLFLMQHYGVPTRLLD
ncbi:MAG: hypothetical protein ACI86H_002606 [bacterium]|jgi:hypothetical protein